MLQSTEPEILQNNEGSRENAWMSPERGNRKDFAGGLGASGHQNRRDQAGERGWKERLSSET